MDFKKWINTERRINIIINRMIDEGVNIVELSQHPLRESALENLARRFHGWFTKERKAKKTEPPQPKAAEPVPQAPTPAPKATGPSIREDDPENEIKKLEAEFEKFSEPTPWQENPPLYKHHLAHVSNGNHREVIIGPDGNRWIAPKEYGGPKYMGGKADDPRNYGYMPEEEWDRKRNKRIEWIKRRINALSGIPEDYEKPSQGAPPTTQSKDPVANQFDKAKEAVTTLRDVLRDPRYEPLLAQVDQAIATSSKPDYYHQMTGGEKKWYDELGDDDRTKYDDEMKKSGNAHIDHGSDDWHVAAARAQKSAQQGYQDAGANWNWASGFANRQKIRKSMNTSWADQLHGESTRFGSWLRRRVYEATGGSGVAADAPGEVQAPTDPKEIARRKAVSDITSTMMKKNPQLKPGGTDQQSVANMTKSDPGLAKADPETQQAVSNFFLQK